MAVMSLHHDDDKVGDIEFRYQPEEMQRSVGSGWNAKGVPGMDDPLLTWAGGEGKTWTFTASFTGKTGRTFAERLWKAAQGEPYKGSPLIWKLVIGQRVIPVIVKNVDLTESFWNKALEADMIEANLTLMKWREYKLSATGS